MKTFLSFIAAMFIAVFVGSVAASVTGWGADYTITGAVILSMAQSFVPMQRGIALDVVLKSAWEAELIRSLKVVKDDFLARVKDMTKHVESDVIDMTKAGAKPGLLVDNTVYPINAAQRTDEGVKIPLHKLTTEVTIITEDELHALPYDKPGSVLTDHKETIQEGYRKLALYSYCPSANGAKTPVLVTTGENDGTGRKRLTQADLIKFRRMLNDLGVGLCELVLSNEHVEDMQLWSQSFINQYQAIASGLVLPMYGFMLSQNQGYAPVFDGVGLTKKAWGAASAGTDKAASVAFPGGRAIKGYGSVKMFHKPPEPRTQQAEINFNAYYVAAPIDDEGFGAIISGNV